MKHRRAVSASVTSSLEAMPSDTIASAEASSVDQANVFSSSSITFREDTRESWESAASRKTRRGIVTRTWLRPTESRKGLGLNSSRGRCQPIPQGFASEGAERVAGNKMALDVEGVLDGGVNRQEPLR